MPNTYDGDVVPPNLEPSKRNNPEKKAKPVKRTYTKSRPTIRKTPQERRKES